MASTYPIDIPEQLRERMRDSQTLRKPFGERKERSRPEKRHRERKPNRKVSFEYKAQKEAELKKLYNERAELKKLYGESRYASGSNDNSELDSLNTELTLNQARITSLEDEIASLEVFEDVPVSGTVVEGVEITLCLKYPEDRTGSFESFIIGSNLSADSPIGKAILGKKVGDIVKVTLPDNEGILTITIIAI